MKFYDWIITQVDRDDPIGDLARDAKRDKNFPKQATTAHELTAYLTINGACHDAVEALRKAWKSFKAHERYRLKSLPKT